MDTDIIADPDHQWPQVEGCASAVWRNEFFISLDYCLAGIDEHISWYLGHHQALAAVLHPLSVSVRTEELDVAVFSPVSLGTFESFLAVVQAGRAFVHGNISVFFQAGLVPLAVFPIGTVAVRQVHIGKAQVIPVTICYGFFSSHVKSFFLADIMYQK